MDIERGNMEILFKEVPYYRINLSGGLSEKFHTYDKVNKALYLEYARRIFRHCSEDEMLNYYHLLDKDISGSSEGCKNIFNLLCQMASKILVLHSGKIQCRLEQMLRWREISFQLGQEIFVCAFLAREDAEKGRNTRFFAWEPIVGSDGIRLRNILERGIAENHFHLNGSAKIFELNWICLMNHIEDRGRNFQKFEKILQHNHVNEQEKKGFYEMCQKAALYRLYLFRVLHSERTGDGEDLVKKRLRKIIVDMECGRISSWEYLSELQDRICLTGVLFGAVNEQDRILDYALEKDTYECNNNPCRLLAGERSFLYRCFRNAFETGEGRFTGFEKNIFYRYLVMRTFFRAEMIQVNRMTGYLNFEQYQNRKEYFIEGMKEYEREMIRLAVNASFMKQNIVSLEARICPDTCSKGLARKIHHKLTAIEDEENIKKIFFVLHFQKQKENSCSPEMPRNEMIRRKTEKYANAIVALFEQENEMCKYIAGIDACAGEIGCRPEVFAQYYRYLLDYSGPAYKDGCHSFMATYHVGEDFLDIVDGLRAIDEVMLFCGMKRGCRLGHALALGIDPEDYYRFKGEILVMPGQDLLDDLAWLMVKQEQYGCPIGSELKSSLEKKFYDLFYKIYSGKEFQDRTVTYLDYYNSWMLRGDRPDNYRLNSEKFLHRLDRVPLQKLARYEFNSAVSNTVRKNEKYRILYRYYHYDEQTRKKGKEEEEFKVLCGYDRLVRMIQDKMIQELVDKEIGIETNPSSNYLIGTLKKYEEHPIIRFNGRKLKETQTNMSLQVSINTDDQGVFDTSLENEYALMTVALMKAKTENRCSQYDTEDIYAWIDYVRRMGITQSFRAVKE